MSAPSAAPAPAPAPSTREVLSTYRLQMHAGFTLEDARALVPYLDALGVTHVHSSPILHSRAGSTHGYDVVDPTRVDPELGDEAALERYAGALAERGMGIVLDIVPNHMAAARENGRWEDVLRRGARSPCARWFDIEWRASGGLGEREAWNRVLLPVLGDLRVRVLQRGEITLAVEAGEVRVRYYENSFPVDPETLPPGIRRALESAGSDPAALERAVAAFNAGEDAAQRMRRLLDRQHYRLVFWRRAAREINYRRFFDVNELIALHMEDPEVFREHHARVLAWRARGLVDGFRIDHPDGLLDPAGYLARLVDAAFEWRADGRYPVWVEKILSPGERLREGWPVSGTTGYDFMNELESVYVHAEGLRRIEHDEYRRLTRRPYDFHAVARLSKRRVLESSFSAAVRRLAERLLRIAEVRGVHPLPRLAELVPAIVDLVVHLPVYRTYVDERQPAAAGEDRALLEGALARAREAGRADARALDLLADAVLGDEPGQRLRFVQRLQQTSGPATAKGVEDTAHYAYVPLVSLNEVGGEPDRDLERAVELFHAGNAHRAERWPKAMLGTTTHDTKRTADVRSRLDVLSEIPAEWGERAARWRRMHRGLQRSVGGRRAPDVNTIWLLHQTIVGVWPAELLAPGAPPVPDDECLATLRERVQAYMLKAVREAKVHTSWTEPDEEFERAVAAYVDGMLTPGAEAGDRFLADLHDFLGRVVRPGLWNALSRALLHLASPGVPDVYQGDELWNFALVDPDNRRPVDYDRRRALLAEVTERFARGGGEREAFLRELVASPEDGRIKLHLVHRVLRARREHPALFVGGGYEPLWIEGPAAAHVVAFARRAEGRAAVTLAPRLLATRLADPRGSPVDAAIWEGTVVRLPADLSDSGWTCAVAGHRVEPRDGAIAVADAFLYMPASLLISG